MEHQCTKLTLRITWSKLINFFLGLDTATSSLAVVGLSNLFMKLSEILPGSNALKPAMCGVSKKFIFLEVNASEYLLHVVNCTSNQRLCKRGVRFQIAFDWAFHPVVGFKSIYLSSSGMHDVKICRYVTSVSLTASRKCTG